MTQFTKLSAWISSDSDWVYISDSDSSDDTLDANSQDNREKYHVLKADGKGKDVKLVDDDVFADIKKACEMGLNNHRTIIYEPEKEKEGEGGEDGDY